LKYFYFPTRVLLAEKGKSEDLKQSLPSSVDHGDGAPMLQIQMI